MYEWKKVIVAVGVDFLFPVERNLKILYNAVLCEEWCMTAMEKFGNMIATLWTIIHVYFQWYQSREVSRNVPKTLFAIYKALNINWNRMEYQFLSELIKSLHWLPAWREKLVCWIREVCWKQMVRVGKRCLSESTRIRWNLIEVKNFLYAKNQSFL